MGCSGQQRRDPSPALFRCMCNGVMAVARSHVAQHASLRSKPQPQTSCMMKPRCGCRWAHAPTPAVDALGARALRRCLRPRPSCGARDGECRLRLGICWHQPVQQACSGPGPFPCSAGSSHGDAGAAAALARGCLTLRGGGMGLQVCSGYTLYIRQHVCNTHYVHCLPRVCLCERHSACLAPGGVAWASAS